MEKSVFYMTKYKAVDFFTDYVICEGDAETVRNATNEWLKNNDAPVDIYGFDEKTNQWKCLT